MTQYRRRPLLVEAWRSEGGDWWKRPKWVKDAYGDRPLPRGLWFVQFPSGGIQRYDHAAFMRTFEEVPGNGS